jgi:hypothetical protein
MIWPGGSHLHLRLLLQGGLQLGRASLRDEMFRDKQHETEKSDGDDDLNPAFDRFQAYARS